MNISQLNPGIQLKYFFEKLLSSEVANEFNSQNELDFISRIDFLLNSEGEFYDLVYESVVYYLVRRFVNTAELLRRTYQTDDYPADFFVEKLREFLQFNISLQSDDYVEELLAILQLCVSERSKNRKSVKKQYLKNTYPGQDEFSCYICGDSLTSDQLEIEHEWPKSMGGSYAFDNLRIACSNCNEVKKGFIGGSDFHYEHISLSLDENSQHFNSEFQRIFKVALCSRSNYKCVVCGEPTEKVGRLNFVRKNQSDSWHFLNINTVCNYCLNPESSLDNHKG